MKNKALLQVGFLFLLIGTYAQNNSNLALPEELAITSQDLAFAKARYHKSNVSETPVYTSTTDTEREAIKETLQKYITGSTEGQPELLKEAFHPDLNLYFIKNGQISIWSGSDYIADTKQGKPTGERGEILSIDFENNTAVAKVEISHPNTKTPYIDYFMLLKADQKWIIIHKMFTTKNTL